MPIPRLRWNPTGGSSLRPARALDGDDQDQTLNHDFAQPAGVFERPAECIADAVHQAESIRDWANWPEPSQQLAGPSLPLNLRLLSWGRRRGIKATGNCEGGFTT